MKQKIECPKCYGRGKVSFTHVWSDGANTVVGECPLCDGKGEIEDLLEMALQHKEEAAIAKSELAKLEQNVYLYLKCKEEQGITLHPADCPKGATGPSPHEHTWLKYLKKAAKKVPLMGFDGEKWDKKWWDRQMELRNKDLGD